MVAKGRRAAPDVDADWWTTGDVAAYLGVLSGTVSSYRSRGQMPAPDRSLNKRTHLWRPQVIIAWHADRPRAGRRHGAGRVVV